MFALKMLVPWLDWVVSDEKNQIRFIISIPSITTLTLEETLELFKLPRTVGKFEGKKLWHL